MNLKLLSSFFILLFLLTQACSPKIKSLKEENEKLNLSLQKSNHINSWLSQENDSIKREYFKLLDERNTTNSKFEKTIIELTKERNKFFQKAQNLKTRLIKIAGNNNDSEELFASYFSGYAGSIRRGKFSPQVRARRVELLQLEFNLSRPLKNSEKLFIKIFESPNYEVTVKNNYLKQLSEQSDLETKKLFVETQKYKFVRGFYSVILYLNDTENDIEEKKIGVADFTLK